MGAAQSIRGPLEEEPEGAGPLRELEADEDLVLAEAPGRPAANHVAPVHLRSRFNALKTESKNHSS